MFGNAVSIAAGFTRPVVISSRTVQGECAGTIGAYVVVNRAGWILTAGHLLNIVRAQQDTTSCARTQSRCTASSGSSGQHRGHVQPAFYPGGAAKLRHIARSRLRERNAERGTGVRAASPDAPMFGSIDE